MKKFFDENRSRLIRWAFLGAIAGALLLAIVGYLRGILTPASQLAGGVTADAAAAFYALDYGCLGCLWGILIGPLAFIGLTAWRRRRG